MDKTAVLNPADFLSSEDPVLSFMIGNIRNAMTNQCQRDLSRFGLTIRQILVIAYLWQHPDELVTQKTLEDHMHLTNPTVTVLIQGMMKKGLITREKVESDGRKLRLLMTEKARELSKLAYVDGMEAEARFYAGFSAEDKRTLFFLLRRIEKNLGIAPDVDDLPPFLRE